MEQIVNLSLVCIDTPFKGIIFIQNWMVYWFRNLIRVDLPYDGCHLNIPNFIMKLFHKKHLVNFSATFHCLMALTKHGGIVYIWNTSFFHKVF